jgi:hypothetical protein
MVWARREMPRPPGPAVLGAALVLLGTVAVREVDLLHISRHDAPSFLAWAPFASQVLPLDRLLLICVAAAVAFSLTTRAQWAVPVTLLAAFDVVAPGVTTREPPWGIDRDRADLLTALDREVTPDGDAVVITAGIPDERCDAHPLALTALWTEVLNVSAGAGRLFGEDLIGSAPRLASAPDGTLLDDGKPLTARAVAIDERVAIDGEPVATVALGELGGEFADDPGGIRFWRTDGRVRLADPDRLRALAQQAQCSSA